MGLNFSRRRSLITLFVLLAVSALVIYTHPLGPRPNRPWEAKPTHSHRVLKIPKRKLLNPLMFAPKETKNRATSFAKSSLYVLMLPSAQIWPRVPILSQTLLSQYPYSLVSSDSGLVIGETTVHDALAGLDVETLTKDQRLDQYRIERYGNDAAWGWPIHEYLQSNPNDTMPLVRQETLKQVQEVLQPHHKWVVLANEHSYLSPLALSEASLNNTRFTSNGPESTEDLSNDVLLLSREAFETYASTNVLPKMDVKLVRNISSTSISKSGWCEPLFGFTGLQRWELQTLFGRDASDAPDADRIRGSAFYRDYILPYVAEERSNWAIDPVGEVYNGETEDGEQITKLVCKSLCQKNSECLAWQWNDAQECRLETQGVKRGIAVNNYYDRVDKSHPLVTSGYMVKRIRDLRISADCDPLEMRKDGSIKEDEAFREGYMQRIRNKIKVQDSEVLKSLRDYADQEGNSPPEDDTPEIDEALD